MQGKAILIFEPILSGHHIRYLEWLVRGVTERSIPVILVTDENNFSNERLEVLKGCNENFLEILYFKFPPGLFLAGGFFSLIRRELCTLRFLQRIVREISNVRSISYVLLPFLDYCLYALAIFPRPFGGITWSALAMRPAFHFNKMGVKGPGASVVLWAKELLYFRLLKSPTLRSLFVIDPCLFEYTKKIMGDAARVVYVADPVEMKPVVERSMARKSLGLSAESRVILIYGAIDFRKGIKELIETIVDDKADFRLTVLAVGKQSAEVAKYMESKPAITLRKQQRLIEINRYISDEEEALVFGACDIVWLGYRGHYGMSGVLVQASYANRPVIACDEGVISWLVSRYDLGILHDVDSMCSANFIELTSSGSNKLLGHTVENFNFKILGGIDDFF